MTTHVCVVCKAPAMFGALHPDRDETVWLCAKHNAKLYDRQLSTATTDASR